LINLSIPFYSEAELRLDHHKTPDILLKLPINVNSFVAYWIESKASFGSIDNNDMNLTQLWAYQDRYGPGIVIYWFGYQVGIEKFLPPSVLTLDDFPSTAITMLSL